MTEITASAPAAASTASSGWAPAASVAPLGFRKDADDSFPVGGAVLLVALLFAAAWAWWYGRVKGLRGQRMPLFPALAGRPSGTEPELRVVDAMHAAGGVRLMVVEWAGGRRVLVAASGAHAPVALDVLPADQGKPGVAP